MKGNEEGDEGELSDLDIDLIPGKEKGKDKEKEWLPLPCRAKRGVLTPLRARPTLVSLLHLLMGQGQPWRVVWAQGLQWASESNSRDYQSFTLPVHHRDLTGHCHVSTGPHTMCCPQLQEPIFPVPLWVYTTILCIWLVQVYFCIPSLACIWNSVILPTFLEHLLSAKLCAKHPKWKIKRVKLCPWFYGVCNTVGGNEYANNKGEEVR